MDVGFLVGYADTASAIRLTSSRASFAGMLAGGRTAFELLANGECWRQSARSSARVTR
jgi:hypothetical protein